MTKQHIGRPVTEDQGLEDHAAEQAVLGALLHYGAPFYKRVSDILTEAHFSEPAHGTIFSACKAYAEAGRTVDLVAIAAHFRDMGALASIGGPAYLADLSANATPIQAYAVDHAWLVRDLALRRSLTEIATGITQYARVPGGKDASALAEDAATKLKAFADAQALERVGQSIHDAAQSFIDRLDQSASKALTTGYDTLDARLGGGFQRGDLIIVCGRPSMGKTSLADNFALNLARAGHAGELFSMEMSADASVMRALAAQSFDAARIAYSRLRNGAPDVSRDQLRQYAARLKDLSLRIDDRAGLSVPQIGRAARATRNAFGGKLDFIIVDYLQIAGRPEARGRNDAAIIGEMTTGLKTLARDMNCAVIALSQLSRSVESREDKRPTLADLRESGAIEQDADVVIGVYREAYYLERRQPDRKSSDEEYFKWEAALAACRDDIEILTLKQRMGPVGVDKLRALMAYDVILEPA